MSTPDREMALGVNREARMLRQHIQAHLGDRAGQSGPWLQMLRILDALENVSVGHAHRLNGNHAWAEGFHRTAVRLLEEAKTWGPDSEENS